MCVRVFSDSVDGRLKILLLVVVAVRYNHGVGLDETPTDTAPDRQQHLLHFRLEGLHCGIFDLGLGLLAGVGHRHPTLT